MSTEVIATIVVTFNRLELLKKTIQSHLEQTRRSDILLIVDNCSTDGTKEYLRQQSKKYDFLKIYTLSNNLGGAGGFHYGLKYLNDTYPEVGWVWLMDDDAVPAKDALGNLLNTDLDKKNIYGSLPNRNGKCSWENINKNKKKLKHINDFDVIEGVNWIPFLGFFIHQETVKQIGLPNKDFFLAADDVEYSLRARKYGADIFIVRDSLLDHPCADTYKIFIGYRFLTNLKLSPWKRYYDTRNRLFISKKYYGWRYFLQTIPASFLRLLATLVREPDRFKQLKAFYAGMFDGILSRSGKRHDHWGL